MTIDANATSMHGKVLFYMKINVQLYDLYDASQPSSAASAGDPTLPSILWDKPNAAKSSNAVSASSATHDAASRQIMHQQLATYLAELTLSHSQNPRSWLAMNRPP